MSAIGRRDFVRILPGLLLCHPSLSNAKQIDQNPKRTKAEWMAEWMKTAKDSDSPLYLGRFKDPIYFLVKPITWKPNSDQVGTAESVEVPAGFVTDLASIPPAFFSLLRPDGEYTYAAIIHDYLYWTQKQPRATADEIFKFAMADFNIGSPTAFTIYESVRRLGGRAWNTNARLRQNGEKRILREYPPNARITWQEWKKRPDVFVP